MKNIPIGTTHESTILVTDENAVSFLGVEGARVLGTPYMIAHLEMTARDSVKPFLDDGYDTVGARVDVRHLAATPKGMQVNFSQRADRGRRSSPAFQGRSVRSKREDRGGHSREGYH
jgi:fluoroacetyl-CoA thioesterase